MRYLSTVTIETIDRNTLPMPAFAESLCCRLVPPCFLEVQA